MSVVLRRNTSAAFYILLTMAVAWSLVGWSLAKQRIAYTGWPGDTWMIGLPTVLAFVASGIAYWLAITIVRNPFAYEPRSNPEPKA